MKNHTLHFNIHFFKLNLVLITVFLFLFQSNLFGQTVSVKDTKNAPSSDPAKTTPEKKEEGKPLKMETGTVVLDPQVVSADYKRTNLKHLKKMKSSFLNYEAEPKFNAIMKNYVDASIKFQEKNYIASRRIFEQNYAEMNTEAEGFSKKYSETYSKLYADASFQLVDLKVNSDSEESIYPVLEKQLMIANEFTSSAQIFTAKGNHVDALYEHKNALQSLFKIYYTINKHKNKNLKLAERVSKNLLLDDDYIPKEYLKEYDDSLGLVFSVREKEREKEREQIKKGLTNKYGELNLSKENESKQPAEPKKDTKDAKEVKDAKAPANPEPAKK
ncbi:MAG TPA: hypothetical protein PK930_17700 [Leptospiraceae bacterium]|nr:hypothetical protein [Leptospiraceae bacterium]